MLTQQEDLWSDLLLYTLLLYSTNFLFCCSAPMLFYSSSRVGRSSYQYGLRQPINARTVARVIF